MRSVARIVWRTLDRLLIVWVTVGLVALAQFLIDALDVPAYTLPSPVEVAQVFQHQFGDRLWPDTVATLTELGIGLAIGLVTGILVGAWIAESRLAQRLVAPYVIALVSAPLIVFAPMFAIWFGFGLLSKVVMVALMTFGPMAVNSIQGFSMLDRDKEELLRSLCATRLEIAVKARLPCALPAIFTGIKIAAVLSVIAVVAAEFIGSEKGLGHTVYYAQTVAQMDLLVAAALLLVSIGLALFYAVDALSRRIVFWHE